MSKREFTFELLRNQLNVDAKTVLEWVVNELMSNYTLSFGGNLSTEESKKRLLSEVEWEIKENWE